MRILCLVFTLPKLQTLLYIMSSLLFGISEQMCHSFAVSAMAPHGTGLLRVYKRKL